MQEHIDKYTQRGQVYADQAMQRAMALRNEALAKMNLKPEDLDKLDRIPAIVAGVGLFVNLLLLIAMTNHAWMRGTAMSNGQPFTAYLALGSAEFGPTTSPSADTHSFCDHGGSSCSLSELCAGTSKTDTYPDGLLKSTPTNVWCEAAAAGTSAASMLWLGFIPGLAATAITGLYAAKEIPRVKEIFDKAEVFGLSDKIQRMVVVGCWAALWLFMFFAMSFYAAMIPDSLGWGTVTLEASFGVLRFCFLIISISAALLTCGMFNLWHADNVIEAWVEFVQTPLFTAKKALYLELMLQMGLYFLMSISEVDWSALLVIFAGFYLDAKNKNFMLMYIVGVGISILFDVVHAAALPNYDSMTPGQSFGASLFVVIFLLKFTILGTIYLYEANDPEKYVNLDAPASKFEEEIAE